MVLFQDINEVVGEKVDFDACAPAGHPAFILMRLQCESEWNFDPYKGPHPTTQNHLELCQQALSLAYKEQVDLFLTPEYAFPLSLVDRLVFKEEKWPSSGKLWCLCCEGQSYDGFKKHLERWKQDDIFVIADAFESLAERRQFVNVLLFVFTLAESGKLVVVVQLKTNPMRDAAYAHEGGGLSLGKIVYCFGSHQPGQVYGIICSDAMNGEIPYNSFFPLANRHAIILHPQLNPSPDHSHMLDLCDSIFKRGLGYQAIYITANWSRNSIQSLSKENHRSSGTNICQKGSNKEIALDKQNIRKGLAFSVQEKDQYSIWQAYPDAHLQKTSLKKSFLSKNHIAQSKTEEVIAQKLWLPKKQKWYEEEVVADWALSTREQSFDYQTLNSQSLQEIMNEKVFHLYLNQLTSLTEDQARKLSTWSGATLSLNAFRELPVSIAHQLAGSRLEELSFNGLEEVSPETIIEFASWRGSSLHLNGISEMNRKLATAFLKWLSEGSKDTLTAKQLFLCGIREIPLSVFNVLFKDALPFASIYLDGLKELSAKHANCIVHWPGNSISLRSVRNLSRSSAQNLSQWKATFPEYQQLRLGITKLNVDVAEQLASWSGAHLHLEKLESVEMGVAEQLSHWSGRFLYLSRNIKELEEVSFYSNWKIKMFRDTNIRGFDSEGKREES